MTQEPTIPKGSNVIPFWSLYPKPQADNRSYPNKKELQPLDMGNGAARGRDLPSAAVSEF